jgi:hypothetical protein
VWIVELLPMTKLPEHLCSPNSVATPLLYAENLVHLLDFYDRDAYGIAD